MRELLLDKMLQKL